MSGVRRGAGAVRGARGGLTDNGRQFTDRFGKHGTRNGEVLFDKIGRKNGIKHRLTAPASPNQNGKVERFHGTFRPDFLDTAGPFTSVEAAQAAVDAWVAHYNAERPHQALDDKMPVTPDQRFAAVGEDERALIDLSLPAILDVAAPPTTPQSTLPSPPPSRLPSRLPVDAATVPAPPEWTGGPRVVPPSGT